MGNWDQRKEVENDGKCDEVCEGCCDADGQKNIQTQFVDILPRAAQGCTLPPILFTLYIQGIIVAVKEAEMSHGIYDSACGLMFKKISRAGQKYRKDFIQIEKRQL